MYFSVIQARPTNKLSAGLGIKLEGSYETFFKSAERLFKTAKAVRRLRRIRRHRALLSEMHAGGAGPQTAFAGVASRG